MRSRLRQLMQCATICSHFMVFVLFCFFFFFFFFNDAATTEFSPLSLPDALPISKDREQATLGEELPYQTLQSSSEGGADRSEEHTSELQSTCNLVCRLLLAQ